MSFDREVKELENVQKDGVDKVFTMYLNTDPSDPGQQGGKWEINLKNALRNFETYLKEGENEEELKSFQTVKEKVKAYIQENKQDLGKGVILFASADDDIWFAKRVQMKVETAMYWQRTPQLDQLRTLSETFPKSGIILVQQDKVKIMDTDLNRVQDTFYYELDIDTDDWRMKQGPRKASVSMGVGEPNVQKDNLKARYEANKQRWYKKIAPKLDKHAKDKKWEKIFIVGVAEASNELVDQMNKPVDEVIQKNMLDQDESKVLQEVFR